MIPTILHSATCDKCDSQIIGIRYKCLHCDDYDLCQSCEHHSSSFHDASHVFAKLNNPKQNHFTRSFRPLQSPQKKNTQFAPSSHSNVNTEAELISTLFNILNDSFSKKNNITSNEKLSHPPRPQHHHHHSHPRCSPHPHPHSHPHPHPHHHHHHVHEISKQNNAVPNCKINVPQNNASNIRIERISSHDLPFFVPFRVNIDRKTTPPVQPAPPVRPAPPASHIHSVPPPPPAPPVHPAPRFHPLFRNEKANRINNLEGKIENLENTIKEIHSILQSKQNSSLPNQKNNDQRDDDIETTSKNSDLENIFIAVNDVKSNNEESIDNDDVKEEEEEESIEEEEGQCLDDDEDEGEDQDEKDEEDALKTCQKRLQEMGFEISPSFILENNANVEDILKQIFA